MYAILIILKRKSSRIDENLIYNIANYGYAEWKQEFDKYLARQASRYHLGYLRLRVNRADDLSFLEKETLSQQEIKMKEKQQSSGS